jgi:bacterioferritin-associated ferredoxin
VPENISLECPFCHKMTISAIHYPPVLQTSVSRAAGRTSTKFYQTKEKTEITSGCSNCGKSQKEVIKAMKEGKDDVEKEMKIFERLKAQGIVKDEMTTKF